MKLFDKWKEAWIESKKSTLEIEFQATFQKIYDTFLENKKRLDLTILDEEKIFFQRKNEIDRKLSLETEMMNCTLESKRLEIKLEAMKAEADIAFLKEEHESKKSILLSQQNAQIQIINSEHDSEIKLISLKNQTVKNILLEEQKEIEHLKGLVEIKKSDLGRQNDDLRNQLKVIEAKAHPSEVWGQAFTAGVTKAWDLIAPLMSGNLEKAKKELFDQAYTKAIGGMNGNHKKNN